MENFYVYVFLDQRYSGNWNYHDIEFKFKPFYVGIGVKYRMTAHFTPYNLNKKSIKNNIVKSILNELNEYPIYYKIFNNLSKEEAINIEIDMIKYFGKIKNNSGILSNLTDGGEGIRNYNHSVTYVNSLKKKIYQYDLNGEFIKEWESLKSVMNEFKCNGGGGFRLSINTGCHCKGYLWSYDKKETLPKHIGLKKSRHQYKIFQKEELVMTFNEKSEIYDFFKTTNISFGNISSCCNGTIKTYLGYVWKKELKLNNLND